jgi:hypothetical protein
MCVSIIRLQGQRVLEARSGFIQPALRPQNVSKVILCGRISRIPDKRL